MVSSFGWFPNPFKQLQVPLNPRTVLLLYYYCTTTVLRLYYYCTTTVLLLFYYCTTTVLLLYYYCTTTVLLLLYYYCRLEGKVFKIKGF